MENNSSDNFIIIDEYLKAVGSVNASFMLLFFLVGVPWNLLVIGVIVEKKLFTRPNLLSGRFRGTSWL